jgi:hypothetical protein
VSFPDEFVHQLPKHRPANFHHPKRFHPLRNGRFNQFSRLSHSAPRSENVILTVLTQAGNLIFPFAYAIPEFRRGLAAPNRSFDAFIPEDCGPSPNAK